MATTLLLKRLCRVIYDDDEEGGWFMKSGEEWYAVIKHDSQTPIYNQ